MTDFRHYTVDGDIKITVGTADVHSTRHEDNIATVDAMRPGNDCFVCMLDAVDKERIALCRHAEKRGLIMIAAIKRGADTAPIDGLKWFAKFYFDDFDEAPFLQLIIQAVVSAYKHNKEKERMR